MIQVKNTETYGWESALRGMRNPMQSWYKSDSYFDNGKYILGEEDIQLAKKLAMCGADHAKYLRQIYTTMDINAPLYWWKEMDTYKIGTVASSESTMHRLSCTPITKDYFSFDIELSNLKINPSDIRYSGDYALSFKDDVDTIVQICESYRALYLETNDKRYWRALIQLLPSSWNQLRTWSGNYQVLRNIYHARKNHKLKEWHDFCSVIKKLPYASELIVGNIKNDTVV